MQKGKGDAISVAMATGNTKALCNFTYGVFGLFSALTHTLLARTRSGAMSCASNCAALSCQPSPAPAPPARGRLLAALLSTNHLCRTVPAVPRAAPGRDSQRGPKLRGAHRSWWEGWHMPGLYKTFCNEECVERLKQFRDVSKPFSTEPGLAGTSQCLRHGPGPAGAPCPSAEHLSQQARPGNGTGAPRPLYLSDLTLYLRTR